MLIRRETPQDEVAVAGVHAAAFTGADGEETPVEVPLVAALRRSEAWIPRLSLVAVVGDVVAGHVVCTRAHVASRPVLGLGPIGVVPARQGRGIGAALMHAVLGAADALDEPLVGLLGDPAYYRRFGFEPARAHGIEAPDDSWGDYFQARALTAFSDDVRGRFRYAPPFTGL